MAFRTNHFKFFDVVGKVMSKIMRPKLQKMLSHAMETTSVNLTDLSSTLLEKNPEIAVGSDVGRNPIDVKEAVNLKLAG